MELSKIIDAYENDGYIYCIITGSFIEGTLNTERVSGQGKQIVKIGKISLKKSEENTLSDLLNRYSTYFPDCKIYKFIRVSNRHKAETKIFEMLSELSYKKEHFYFDENKIDNAFNEIKMLFPDINTIVINSEIDQISRINKNLRHYFKNN